MYPILRSLVLLFWCVLGTYAAVAPTLTDVTPLGTGTEDLSFTITYDMLKSASNAVDGDGDVIHFRVMSVTSGSLTFRDTPPPSSTPNAVIPGTTLLGSGMEFIWTPTANAAGALSAFKIRAWDGTSNSNADVQVTVNVSVVADRPTLSNINTLGTATEDQPFTITYSMLEQAANENDVDSGDVVTFQVQSVTSGTLTIRNTSPATAPIPVTPGTILPVSGKELIWTPAANASGNTLLAFKVRAWDGALNSVSDVQVTVNVSAVDDRPTLTKIDTLKKGAIGFGDEDSEIIIRHIDLSNNADEADIDSAPINFKIMSLGSGSLTFRKQGTTVTAPVVTGTILKTDEELVWQPPANLSGELTACALVATADGADSTTTIPLKILVDEVDDPLSIAPNFNAVEYNLNTNVSAFLVPDDNAPVPVTVSDPESKPTLIKNGKGLTITGSFINRQGLEDHLLVGHTGDCKVEVSGNGTWNIFARNKSTVKLAAATFDSGLGVLVITVDAQAEAYASTITTPLPPSRPVILGWLLQCVAYGNHAGVYAQAPTTVRQVSLIMLEADAKKGAAPFRADISLSLAIANEPPGSVKFDTVYAEPGGNGELNLSIVGGKIDPYDIATSNDELTFELSVPPSHGDLIDLLTQKPVTSFKGIRLNNAATPIRLTGIGYRNTNAKAANDGFRLRAKDAGNESSETNVTVTMGPKPDKTLIISDPVVVLNRGVSHVHTLLLSGKPGAVGTLSIGRLADFPDPIPNPNPNPGVFVLANASPTTDQVSGMVSVDMTITPPISSKWSSNYLCFTVTWKLTDNNLVTQPFIIRLDPPPPVILLQTAN